MSDALPRVVLIGGDGRLSGVPRHITHLTDALKHQARITVLSGPDHGGYRELAALGAAHVALPGLSARWHFAKQWRALKEATRCIDAYAPELVWVHARMPGLMLRVMLAAGVWAPACPVAFTYHGLPTDPGHAPVPRWASKLIERILLRRAPAHHLIFLDPRSAGNFALQIGGRALARHRIHVLPNASAVRPFPRKRQAGRRTLVMTTRTCRQKDLGFAFRLLGHLPPPFRLVLCGPGTDAARFQRRIPENVRHRVTCLGPLADVRPVLQVADAYLLTSRYEGTPIGALEAFEAGLPMILRDFAGSERLVDLHPLAMRVSERTLSSDAVAIEALLTRFEADDIALSRQTRAAWQANWSPEVFNIRARALVKSLLGQRDFPRDGQVPHQDHRRSAIGPAPTQPPMYTDVSP